MVDRNEKISDLIQEAIRLWPSSIDIKKIYSDNDRYHIDGIYEKKEKISEKFLGGSSAILQFNLHDAIYEILHNNAEHGKIYMMSDLPLAEVHASVVSRLKSAISDPELGWNDEEISMARRLLERDAQK